MSNYWSQYWQQGYLTSFGEDIENNYEGLLKNVWNSYFYELNNDELQQKVTEIIIEDISTFMEIDKAKIKFYDHHTCHAMYGYFANPNKKGKTIAITVDAYGDGRNQTVWKIENDKFFVRKLVLDGEENINKEKDVSKYLNNHILDNDITIHELQKEASSDEYSYSDTAKRLLSENIPRINIKKPNKFNKIDSLKKNTAHINIINPPHKGVGCRGEFINFLCLEKKVLSISI